MALACAVVPREWNERMRGVSGHWTAAQAEACYSAYNSVFRMHRLDYGPHQRWCEPRRTKRFCVAFTPFLV